MLHSMREVYWTAQAQGHEEKKEALIVDRRVYTPAEGEAPALAIRTGDGGQCQAPVPARREPRKGPRGSASR